MFISLPSRLLLCLCLCAQIFSPRCSCLLLLLLCKFKLCHIFPAFLLSVALKSSFICLSHLIFYLIIFIFHLSPNHASSSKVLYFICFQCFLFFRFLLVAGQPQCWGHFPFRCCVVLLKFFEVSPVGNACTWALDDQKCLCLILTLG